MIRMRNGILTVPWRFVCPIGMSSLHSILLTLLATDVTNISQTLNVDSVDLQGGRRVAITVSFQVQTLAHSLERNIVIPYSGKFLHATKFHGFRGWFGCCENMNHEH